MQRRYLFISITVGVLFGCALIGYLLPSPQIESPIRLLFGNKGGNVIFKHERHLEDMHRECKQCHHTINQVESITPCHNCHVKKFDDAFAQSHQEQFHAEDCIACHHAAANIEAFPHDMHAEEYTEDCQTCHHDTSIEDVPQACSNCHTSENNGTLLALKQAVHSRCYDCHEDVYDKGLDGCRTCHTRGKTTTEKVTKQNCSLCHELPINRLIPTSTAAFHRQCKSCHKKNGRGPFGEKSCNQCHMKR